MFCLEKDEKAIWRVSFSFTLTPSCKYSTSFFPLVVNIKREIIAMEKIGGFYLPATKDEFLKKFFLGPKPFRYPLPEYLFLLQSLFVGD